MNLFHGGRLASMPPKLMNDDGDVLVMRPLAYCAEADLSKFANAMSFPIIPCDLMRQSGRIAEKRHETDVGGFERKMPGRKDTMIRALGNVRVPAICWIGNCLILAIWDRPECGNVWSSLHEKAQPITC